METYRMNVLSFLQTFFPFQLAAAQLKHNLPGVVAWTLFFLVITGNLGAKFGLPILFYSPEYLGKVSFWSFGLLGFSFGGMITAFNTYSYSKLGQRFPFLIVIKRPFLQFSKNNMLIPTTFVVIYLTKMIHYQWYEEYATITIILSYVFSFLTGVVFFIFLSLVYFFPIFKKLRLLNLVHEDDYRFSFQSTKYMNAREWYRDLFVKKNTKFLYLGPGFRLYLSRSVNHIDPQIIDRAIVRNKINTSIFELATILLFLGLSLFPEIPIFELPAAMSIVLLISLLYMLYSIVQTWLRRWTPLFFVLLFIGMNYLSTQNKFFSFKNYAYGLNYTLPNQPVYSIKEIEKHALSEGNVEDAFSYHNYIQMLDNWKAKTGEKRPKLILVNSSGGGLRSALWTFNVLQKLDQECNGELKKNIHLYTGASGGLVGAAYFRELCLRMAKGEVKSIYSTSYYDALGQDMLNRLAFSASTRDVFLRIQTFQQGANSYPIDRGKAFEDQLHVNTSHVMDHPLSYYTNYEKEGTIPLLIATPTIINDGRRLLMSAQPLCFLTAAHSSATESVTKTYENIDYLTFFKDVSPLDINFSSMLRASATFPFVTPMVTMPTKPEIQLMDAGIRDNYGGKITLEILSHLQDWIQKNTSGVVILQIRDTKKILKNMQYKQLSLMDKLTLPLGNLYSNFPKTQDFDQEQLFDVGLKLMPFKVDVISFNLREKINDQISLSWHLSTQEKAKIQQAFYTPLNQAALQQLKQIVRPEKRK
jgi:hypothetical protein